MQGGEVEKLANDMGIPIKDILVKKFDKTPKKKLKKGNYLINISDDDDGTHWTGMIINDNECFYFDSFGMPPPEYVIEKIPSAMKKNFHLNRKQIQDYDSDACGLFCLAFFTAFLLDASGTKSRNKYMLDYLDKLFKDFFSNIPKENDSLVADFLENFKKTQFN